MTARGVAVLGSTGSIGTTALRVLSRHRDSFEVVALTAYDNAPLLEEQARDWQPSYVGIVRNGGEARAGWCRGEECLVEAACHADADIVLNAIVGAAGLDATLAALAAGKRVALANKESLVLAGELVIETARHGGGLIVPVDSEHSAILQCISAGGRENVRRVVLTASGGPFRGRTAAELERVTVADTLRHPTWRMGRKITVDSATLANKALEVIEAHFLFGLSYDRIDVVVHPQSVVHSLVEFVDGSVVAQLGMPSMELPILYSLTHPRRLEDREIPAFDPVALSPLTFEPVAVQDFPALRLGYEAGLRGGAAPAVFSAANEQAVALFLEERITFSQIAREIEAALASLGDLPGETRAELLDADRRARNHVREGAGVG